MCGLLGAYALAKESKKLKRQRRPENVWKNRKRGARVRVKEGVVE